jgi:hypothetical protein
VITFGMIGNDVTDFVQIDLFGQIFDKLFGKRFPDRIDQDDFILFQ